MTIRTVLPLDYTLQLNNTTQEEIERIIFSLPNPEQIRDVFLTRYGELKIERNVVVEETIEIGQK